MVARTLDEHGLEAIMVGNAAAALQGAPVTTVDIDADLADIIKRKRAAGRPSDRAVLPVLQQTLHEKEKDIKKGKASGAEARK